MGARFAPRALIGTRPASGSFGLGNVISDESSPTGQRIFRFCKLAGARREARGARREARGSKTHLQDSVKVVLVLRALPGTRTPTRIDLQTAMPEYE